MAIQCEFIDLIIPIQKIDKVYPGGFSQFKEDNKNGFSGKLWHDQFLFRDGAMNPRDIRFLAEEWEKMGLEGIVEREGSKQWKDFCVVEGLFGGPTLPCDWIEYDRNENCVYMKGKSKGEIIGPRKE